MNLNFLVSSVVMLVALTSCLVSHEGGLKDSLLRLAVGIAVIGLCKEMEQRRKPVLQQVVWFLLLFFASVCAANLIESIA